MWTEDIRWRNQAKLVVKEAYKEMMRGKERGRRSRESGAEEAQSLRRRLAERTPTAEEKTV